MEWLMMEPFINLGTVMEIPLYSLLFLRDMSRTIADPLFVF